MRECNQNNSDTLLYFFLLTKRSFSSLKTSTIQRIALRESAFRDSFLIFSSIHRKKRFPNFKNR